MGRKPVSLAMNSDALRERMKGRETFSERAEKYGVSKQAVNGWLDEGRIPPRALCEIALDLNFTADDVRAILNIDEDKKSRKWTVTLTVSEE